MAKQQQDFIVSARKYRPESWQEVVGQEAITETLHNAIDQGHMAHAYLFCGPRGVGKTTCARIFAKEINRSEDQREDEDFAFNIFELDAASNNSVDDIRSLTDQVRIPPQVGKYKVYIIDEVHMLSKAAFNAFLKTLEEPPKHAIFILATTEKHKIIPTILSRCQIYDFSRIKVDDIVEQLESIAKQENISYEKEALHVIGQKADGAMRDALSIFDQLSSFTNDKLTYEAVLKNLHVLDYDYYFRLIDFLGQQDYAEALLVLDDVLKQGFDGSHFLEGLGNHLRDLLVCQNPKTLPLLEVAESVRQKYAEQSSSVSASWLMQALKLVVEAEFKYRTSSHQRLLIETALLNLASIGTDEKKKSSNPIDALRPKPSEKPSKPAAVAEDEKPQEAQVEEEPKEPEPDTSETDSLEEVEPTLPPAEEASASESTENTLPKESADEQPASSTPSEEPTETPAPRRRKRKASTISLKIEDEVESDSDQKKPESEADSNDAIPEESNDGDDQPSLELKDAWTQLCEQAMHDGKRALYGIMAKQSIESQVEEDTVTVVLSHDVDQEEFNLHRSDVLGDLRRLTRNRNLQLTTRVDEQQTDEKLFTPQDKFEHLAKQNPLLRKLRSDLDLDITF
jgi:DNA polymerase-3 subunit gamma/tau